jgi:hypothetical protein
MKLLEGTHLLCPFATPFSHFFPDELLKPVENLCRRDRFYG